MTEHRAGGLDTELLFDLTGPQVPQLVRRPVG